VAEQLEHVKSPKLINELDRFMDFPKKDPHGEVIPDAEGNYRTFEKVTLASLDSGTICKLISVNDGSVEFLRYVSEIGLALSSEIKVIEKRSFDNSVKIEFNDSIETVSQKFADNVFVEILSN
jgi:DtxR family Mn-dependent transcriptional regulator